MSEVLEYPFRIKEPPKPLWPDNSEGLLGDIFFLG